MTLDTLNVEISPPDLVRMLMAHTRRGETVTAIFADQDKDTVPYLAVVNCEVCIDGCDNGVMVYLKADGTWTVSAPFILGEKA